MERDEWIIDGNYLNSMEYRLGYADTVFYFDLPTEECLANVEQRKGKPREDMPDGMIDREDPEFIEFIKNYNRDTKPHVEELLSRFGGEVIVIKSREDKKQYLQ
jgi:adenylate kinase family enzyme